MSLHDRIKEARRNKGMTQTELGQCIGVAKTTIAGYEKQYEPSAAQLGAIADSLDVDITFLLQDEIKKRNDIRATQEEMENLVKKYRSLDDYGQEAVDSVLDVEYRRCEKKREADKQEKILAVKKQKDQMEAAGEIAPKMVEKLIYVYPAAAGNPLYAESDFERLEFPEDSIPYGADFGIRISGKSMEPTIKDGAIVWVHKVLDLEDGTVGVFMLNDSAVCKRFYRDEWRNVRLESDNPEFGPVEVGEFDTFTIVGEVVGSV